MKISAAVLLCALAPWIRPGGEVIDLAGWDQPQESPQGELQGELQGDLLGEPLGELGRVATELPAGTRVFMGATHRHVGSVDGKGGVLNDTTKTLAMALGGRIAAGPLVIAVESGVVVVRPVGQVPGDKEGSSDGPTLELSWLADQPPRSLGGSFGGRAACLAINGDASRVALVTHGEKTAKGVIYGWENGAYRSIAEKTIALESLGGNPKTPEHYAIPKGVRFALDGCSAWAQLSTGKVVQLDGAGEHRFPKSMFGSSAVSDFQFDVAAGQVVWFERDFGRLGAAKIGSSKVQVLAEAGHGTMGRQAGWIDLSARWIALTGNDDREHFVMDRASERIVQSLGTDYAIAAHGGAGLVVLSRRVSVTAPFGEGPPARHTRGD